MTQSNARRNEITKILSEKFTPDFLEVMNESHLHAGHGDGFDGSGETHLRIRIIAKDFGGMSRVARHRAINSLLTEVLDAGLHALAIEAYAPDEPNRFGQAKVDMA